MAEEGAITWDVVTQVGPLFVRLLLPTKSPAVSLASFVVFRGLLSREEVFFERATGTHEPLRAWYAIKSPKTPIAAAINGIFSNMVFTFVNRRPKSYL